MNHFLLALFSFAVCFSGQAEAAQTWLATTFPVYQITRHVIEGVPGINLELMIPAQAGCPHDYALTPQDRRKLEQADVLIINGLGLEHFLAQAVGQKQERHIVNSSQDVTGLLAYEDEPDHAEHEDHHGHEAQTTNPHLFASPRMAARMSESIAVQLGRIDPEHAARFAGNASTYARRMDTLADEFAALGKRLANNRIVTQHGVFDYLARDMGLEVTATVQSHETQLPSASDMIRLAKIIKERQVGAIITEPQYPDKIAATLAKETGVATAKLDPVANGPANAGPDHYETTMRANLATLERTLGTH